MIDHEQKFEELAEKCFNGDIYGFFLTSRDYTLYADQLLEIKTGSDGKKRYLFGKKSGDTGSPIWAYDWRGYSCLNHHNKGINELGDIVKFYEREPLYVYEFSGNPVRLLGSDRINQIADKITINGRVFKDRENRK